MNAIEILIDTNVDVNSYKTMQQHNKPLIFLSENKALKLAYKVNGSDGTVFDIMILSNEAAKKYIRSNQISDLFLTRINPIEVDSKNISLSFSTVSYPNMNDNFQWNESKDKLGLQIYKSKNGCWRIVK